MNNSENKDELLKLREACEILKCHPNTLRSYDKKGLVKAVRMGLRGDRRFRREDIEKLLK
jgi:excisionase family DNA binding protein